MVQPLGLRIWGTLLSLACVALSLPAVGCLPAARCAADQDCSGGRVCVDGTCDDRPGNTASGSSGQVTTSTGTQSSSARSGTGGISTSRVSSGPGSGAVSSSSGAVSTGSSAGGSGGTSATSASSNVSGSSSLSGVTSSSSAVMSSSFSCPANTCAVAGCVGDGTVNTANPCQVCDLARSNQTWSPVLDGRACDDNDPCTPSSTCSAAGVCTGVGTRDVDGDTYIDVACTGGTDCDDNNNAIHPGVPDPVDGITPQLDTVDPGGVRGQALDAVADSNGHVHAVFANTSRRWLEYLTNSSGLWAVATLDAVGVGGGHARLTIGPNNTVHVVHWEDGGNDLVYVTNTTGAWVRELVTGDTTADSGQYASLLVDPDGTVHVVYYDATGDDLIWRQRTAAGWQAPVTLDTVGTAGNGTTLFLDAAGQKRVGYHSSNCDCLRQGVLAAPFTSEIVDNPSPDVGYGPRAFVEPSGAEHYFHTGGGVLRHSHRASAAAAWINVDASPASVPVHARFGAARLSDGRLWACVADGDPLNGMGLLLVRSANTGWASQDNSDVTVLAVGFNVPPPCSVVALPNGHAAVMYAINDTQVEARLTQDALPAPFTVDGAGDRGRNPAMVREANGTLHVASYDASATSLRYSRKVPGTLWTNEEVDNVASVGSHASIAVDANGTVHVAYYDASANALRYTSGTSGAWAPPVVVDNLNNAGLYTSIMLDNAGAPAIAYVATGEARLARLSGTTWTRETVATGVTAYLSAARDGLGRFHLGWQAGTVLTYTRGVPGTWEVPRAADAVPGGQYVRLVLDAQDNPHLFHYAPTPDDLRHAFSTAQGDAGSFTAEIAAATGVSGQYAAAAVDAQGNLGAVFLESGVGMVLAQKNGATWSRLPLNAANYQGGALVLGPNGAWDVVFYDDALNNLRAVSSAVPGLAPATVVAPATDPGTWSAMAVDALGTPHVAWRDNRASTLRYGTLSQGLWFHTTLDDAADTGRYVSLKAGGDGALHLAYHHESAGDLIYGRLLGGVFTRELVDVAGDVGEYTSLVVTANNTPHIAYHDVSNRDLKHAFKSGATWIVSTRESTGDQGRFAALALDQTGSLHVAWRDETTNDLRYMSNVGGAWNASVVAEGLASTNDYGSYASIAVDGQGVVSIAHRDATADDLRVVTNRTGAFVGQPVDANTNVGTYASMCVDGTGNQAVAYRNESTTDLKLAYGDTTGLWQTFFVEQGGDALGTHASLAQAPDGAFYVSYYNDSLNRLRVARVVINNAVDDNCDGR